MSCRSSWRRHTGHTAGRPCRSGRAAQERVGERRIGNDDLTQPDTVEEQRVLDHPSRQIVIEDPYSSAKDRCLVILWSERKRKPRREIVFVAGRRLPVVTQTKG